MALACSGVLLISPYMQAQSPAPRPWVQGIGLHVEEKGQWRTQVMLPPDFLPGPPASAVLPSELKWAPTPSVLMHFKQLRPGLQQMVDLSGGLPATLLPSASHGSRAGFYLHMAQGWLKNGSAVLEPLAQREAWVLHFGRLPAEVGGKRQRVGGTAVFVPGKLPGRNRLALELARVNPLSVGVRSRKVEVNVPGKGTLNLEAIRGIGGVLYLAERPEGMWLFDRESLAISVLGGDHENGLGNRPRWVAEALSGEKKETLASLWIIPKLTGAKAFEDGFSKIKVVNGSTTAFLGASPRSSALTFAMGGGPVASLLRALTEPSEPYDLLAAPDRDAGRKAIQADLKALVPMFRPESLNLSWFGWTAGGEAKTEDPGMSPSLAAAVPLQRGKSAEAAQVLRRLLPRLFKGTPETRKMGGIEIMRVRTNQAFAPSWAIVKEVLVVGFSDEAVGGVVMGLAGQAPTLSDTPLQGWGAAALDGDRLTQAMEKLLVTYLATFSKEQGQGRSLTADEAAAETAATFGPFFGVLKHMGKVTLQLDWKPSGIELGPR